MWISLFLSFLLGETLVPPYVQRLLIAKNPKTIKKGMLWSGFLSIPFFMISGMLGLVALILNPDIKPDMAMPHLIQTVLPTGLRAIACAGIISIVMSSADSFLNSASVCLVRDIISPFKYRKNEDLSNQKQGLFFIQLITLIIGALATILALKIGNVLDILLFAYRFWAPVILVPLLAIMIGLTPNAKCFYISAFLGALSVIVLSLYNNNLYEIDSTVVGFFVNLIAFSITYRFIKNK